MIVELRRSLNVATLALVKFSRCCSTVLTEFFPADDETNVHPLPVSWYFVSFSLWWYLCSCTHNMYILWSIAVAFSSSSWLILSKVLTLNVTICIVLLHLSCFCLCLSFVADFSNNGARAPTSAERVLFYAKNDAV